MSRMFFIFIVIITAPVHSDGLAFSEEMKGYGQIDGVYEYMDVQLNVTIDDIDLWKESSLHSAAIEGVLNFGEQQSLVIGTLNIFEPGSSECGEVGGCYYLVYRLILQNSDFPIAFVGYKTVMNDEGLDSIDDMTTLIGCFTDEPTVLFDSIINTDCNSELRFYWWDFSVLWDFTTSFETIDTPWYRKLSVKRKFVEVAFSSLASVYFPWLF